MIIDRDKKEMLDNLYSYFEEVYGEENNSYKRNYKIFDTIFKSMKTGIYIYNRDMKLVYVNEAILKILNISWKELKEKNYEWLCKHYHQCDNAIRTKRKKLLDNGTEFNFFLRFNKGNDSYLTLQVINSQLKLENDYIDNLFLGEVIYQDNNIKLDEDIMKVFDNNSQLKHDIFLKNFTKCEAEVIKNIYYYCLKATKLAKLMNISPKTVRKHISNINRKLNINNILQLIKIISNYLLPDEKMNLEKKKNV
ncbi:MAG: hypothetical protein KA792_09915 [Bacteroidales bacterium]|nr:hypothetical protein [Bacteroidales bacterium]